MLPKQNHRCRYVLLDVRIRRQLKILFGNVVIATFDDDDEIV